jgi:hypothetical protein
MNGADMYIGYKNSTGGYTISHRSSSGYNTPSAKSVQDAYSIATLSVGTSYVSSGGMSFSFCRPTVSSSSTISANQNYIYAGSSSIPSSIDSVSSSFSVHSYMGSYSTDYTVNSTTNTTETDSGNYPILTTTNYSVILTLHGALMWIAWIFCSMSGLFVARYLKGKLPIHWFRIHQLLMLCGTGLLTVVGCVLIFLYKTPPHFDSIHGKIGLAIFVVMICEIILGFVIDSLYDPDRTRPPTHDQVHWWTGRILVVLGIVNVQFGFSQFDEYYYMSTALVICNWVFVGAVITICSYCDEAKWHKSH